MHSLNTDQDNRTQQKQGQLFIQRACTDIFSNISYPDTQ